MKRGILILLLSTNLYGGISQDIMVKGYVISFDKKNVTIFSSPENITVPRNSIPKYYKIKGGVYVKAKIKSDFILKEIKKNKKKAL